MSLKANIDLGKLPQHVAVIMDGNGRWAKARGKSRVTGHRQGAKAVKQVTEACAELGVKYLTLYAFSLENWNRPKLEVTALMELLVKTIRKEIKTLMDNDIKLSTIGHTDQLPKACQKKLNEAMEITRDNKRMELILALSYSSRWEIINATKRISADIEAGNLKGDSIDEQVFDSYLNTANIPDPELMIRTSGEQRISNFLLWQIAYTELYFTDVLWPDFGKEELYQAILSYQNRERRFGMISEQLKVS